MCVRRRDEALNYEGACYILCVVKTYIVCFISISLVQTLVIIVYIYMVPAIVHVWYYDLSEIIAYICITVNCNR